MLSPATTVKGASPDGTIPLVDKGKQSKEPFCRMCGWHIDGWHIDGWHIIVEVECTTHPHTSAHCSHVQTIGAPITLDKLKHLFYNDIWIGLLSRVFQCISDLILDSLASLTGI